MRALSDDFEKSVGAAVISTARRIQLTMTADLQHFGMTYAQWTLLAFLVRRGPVHQSLIAEHVGSKPSTICRVLDGMQRNGWIARETCPDDPRRKLIVLQPKVRPVWKELKRIAHRVRRTALRGIDPERQRELLILLDTVRSNLSEADPQSRTRGTQ